MAGAANRHRPEQDARLALATHHALNGQWPECMVAIEPALYETELLVQAQAWSVTAYARWMLGDVERAEYAASRAISRWPHLRPARQTDLDLGCFWLLEAFAVLTAIRRLRLTHLESQNRRAIWAISTRLEEQTGRKTGAGVRAYRGYLLTLSQASCGATEYRQWFPSAEEMLVVGREAQADWTEHIDWADGVLARRFRTSVSPRLPMAPVQRRLAKWEAGQVPEPRTEPLALQLAWLFWSEDRAEGSRQVIRMQLRERLAGHETVLSRVLAERGGPALANGLIAWLQDGSRTAFASASKEGRWPCLLL